ncbi:DNA repair and recombination protein RAD54-like protein, partial [Trifolium medium]|nr:DNA repair and recombination protein RAD54-like protein [Trifolium medium]
MRTLCKDIKVFGLNQISILQRIEHSPCENKPYRWSSSEDCSSLPHTKLLLGKFLSDLSWLIVTSVLMKVAFCARSVENKMVYQVLGGDNSISSSSNTESHIDVIGFKNDNGMLVPIASQVAITNTKRVDQAQESHTDEASPSYNVDGLRRSKRRHVQPDRYLGCEVKELDVGSFRNRPPVRIDTSTKEDDLPLSCLFRLQQQKSPEKITDKCQKVNQPNPCRELLVYNRRAKNREVKKSRDVDHNEHQNPLAIIPFTNQDADPIAVEPSDQNGNVARSGEHASSEISSKYRHLINTPKPRKNINLLDFPEKSEDAAKSDDVSSRCQFFGTPKLQKKSLGDLGDMDLGNRWEGIKRKTNKGFKEGKYRSTYLRNPGEGGTHRYKDRTLNASAYKNLINSYLSNINTTIPVEETPITDQWKKCNTTNVVGQNEETDASHEEYEKEKAEEDMLWKELEVGLASIYFDDS